MGRSRRNLLRTASAISSKGIPNAMMGAAMPNMVADFWLHTTPKQPSRKPIVRLPQSPRKIDAGLLLYTSIPSREPASGAITTARVWLPSRIAATSMVTAARNPAPAVSPSTPSIRLNALVQMINQATVTRKLTALPAG
jgi:hypothetical protein